MEKDDNLMLWTQKFARFWWYTCQYHNMMIWSWDFDQSIKSWLGWYHCREMKHKSKALF